MKSRPPRKSPSSRAWTRPDRPQPMALEAGDRRDHVRDHRPAAEPMFAPQARCARGSEVRDCRFAILPDLDPGGAMPLSVGDHIPDVPLMRMTGAGPAPVGSKE